VVAAFARFFASYLARGSLQHARVFGARIGAVAWFVRVRRKHVLRAMERTGIRDAEKQARAMYASLGTYIGEFLWFAASTRPVSEVVSFHADSLAMLNAARERGPVVLATAHLGNWELAAMRVAEEMPLSVVVHPLHDEALASFVGEVRAAKGVHTIEPHGALEQSLRALREGRVVAVLVDQVPRKKAHGYVAQFMGVRAWVEKSAALLAQRVGGTLLVAAAQTGPRGGQQLRVLSEIRYDPADASWVKNATLKASRAVEAAILEEPSLWLWLHKRWRKPMESTSHRR